MQSYDIGRVFTRTFKLVVEGVMTAGLLLLAVHIASTVFQFAAMRSLMEQVQAGREAGDPLAGLKIFTSGAYWGSLVIGTLLSSFGSAGSLAAYLRIGKGEAVSLADCAQVGIAKLLPTLGLFILWGLGVGGASMLLFVPGMMLMCAWSVAMPVLIAENSGVIASFGRSRELTRGSRLMIFITLLAMVVLIYVLLFGIAGLVMGVGMMGVSSAMQTNPVIALAMIPFSWIMVMVINAMLAAIYVETINVKEVGGAGRVADVFT